VEHDKLFAPTIRTKRIRAKKKDEPWFKRDGDWYWKFQPSKAKNLAAWEKEHGGYFYREVTKEIPRNVGKPAPRFPLNSDQKIRELLYDYLYAGRWRAVGKDLTA
jgi:hypothetical protein